MEETETLLREKGISFIDKGAKIIDFKNLGNPKLDIAIIRNRNGTTNYLLRDVGAAIERAEKYDFDNMTYVVMDEQSMHMQRLFKILELMGGRYAAIAKKLQHVSFGKVMGMSTRRGTARFLDDVLADASAAMHTKMRENPKRYAQISDPDSIADTLGISAVVVQDMSGKRINSYPFDIRRMTSLKGELATADFSLLQEPHAIDLIRLIARYPDMVAQTLKTLEPTTILTYLFRLTHQLSSSYDVLRVVGAPEGEEVSKARAALYEAARQSHCEWNGIVGSESLRQVRVHYSSYLIGKRVWANMKSRM